MNQNPARGTGPWCRGRPAIHCETPPARDIVGAFAGPRSTPGEDPISRRRTRALQALALLVILTVTGCSRWQLASAPTPAALTEEPPELVRVTLGNGARLEITDPVARNDSIVGTTLRPVCTLADAMDPNRGCPERPVPIGVGASDMVELELRRPSVMRSTVLITGLLAGAYQVVRVSIRAFGT